jgi:hypothetical protein
MASAGAAVAVRPLHMCWKGTWSSAENPGVTFAFRLSVDATNSRHVVGTIAWTLTACPWPMPEREGTEWVEGTWDAASRRLALVGTRVEPVTLLAKDEYRLDVDKNGAFSGVTRGNEHTWSNRIQADPCDAS